MTPLTPPLATEGGARRTASVAGTGLVPVDDPAWPPDVGSTDRLVWGRHLLASPIRADGADRYAEIGRNIARCPPLGVRVGLAHAPDGSGGATCFLRSEFMDTCAVDAYIGGGCAVTAQIH